MRLRRVAFLLVMLGVAASLVLLVVAIRVVRRRAFAEAVQRRHVHPLANTLLHARNFDWTQVKGAQRRWVLHGTDARYSVDGTSLTLTVARLSMQSADGAEVTVNAPRASVKLSGSSIKEAFLSGGIELRYQGYRFTTAQATFLPDRDEITAPGPVKIVGQGIQVEGVGLEGHPGRQLFTLLSHTVTQVYPKRIPRSARRKPG
ncbi:MAG: LPS export ABC transporter periplasmic protein LptC [Deltaproteobacteria bacterium]|nr:LPS export ABC transporter periplasmic protein LptC [Deltaproteobacteria bacterium]